MENTEIQISSQSKIPKTSSSKKENIYQISTAEKEKVCEVLKKISNFIGKKNTHTKQEIKNELTKICEEEGYTNDPLKGIVPIEKINYEILDNNNKEKDKRVNEILKNNYQLFENQLTAYESTGNGNCFYNSLSLLLTGQEDWSNNLRLVCLKSALDSEIIKENPRDTEHKVLSNISTITKWSGGEEQCYLAKKINLPIITITQQKEGLRVAVCWIDENFVVRDFKNVEDGNFLWIFHIGNHYVPLIPSSEFQNALKIQKLLVKNSINSVEEGAETESNTELENKKDIFLRIDNATNKTSLERILNEVLGQIYCERGKKQIRKIISNNDLLGLEHSLDEYLKNSEGGKSLGEIERNLEERQGQEKNVNDPSKFHSEIDGIIKETKKKVDEFITKRETLFPFLNSTNNEPEFALANCISSVGTDYSQGINGKLPRGAALITDSGNLAKNKIKKIIHAASGSHDSDYHPTKESVILSVQNSIILAERQNVKSLAIPLIGGNIFLNHIKKTSPDITPEKLAEMIVKAAINQRNALDKDLKIVFIDYNNSKNFQQALDKLKEVKEDSDWKSKFNDNNTKVVDGDITNFSIHGCEAIVNAANCEVQFGDGVSGDISSKTGQSAEINQRAREIINQYNQITEKRERKKEKSTNSKSSISAKLNKILGEKLLTRTIIFSVAVYLGLIAYRVVKKWKIRINSKKRKQKR
jgi:O-acetyl-ADP-ribose deacetylase (regulator of RNase III)